MQGTIVIALLVAASHAAPLDTKPEITETTLPDIRTSARPDTVPVTIEQPINNPPEVHEQTEPPRVVDQPEAKPDLVQKNEETPQIFDNAIKPEVDLPLPAHHVQEHGLDKYPDRPLQPASQHKPSLFKPEHESEESDEDLDENDLLEGLLSIELAYYLAELGEQYDRQHSHHTHHGHSHYNPHRDADLPCKKPLHY